MTPRQNDLLCRVEGDAPMGKVMRRHWLPVCMSEEVAETDGTPRRARLLGEDMVVFRDTQGRVGVLDERCPHRRASLVYGRNEECGLRCLYHGWKFDVEGKAVDLSSEPADAKLQHTMRTRAYPVREAGGFVWAWLGDPENPAPFDPPVWAKAPADKIAIMKIHGACNWAQVLEGAIDSAHSSSLHSTNMPTAPDVSSSTATDSAWLRPSADKSPRLEVERTPYGFRYAAIRKPIHNPESQDYVRTTLFAAPFSVMIPPTDRYRLNQMLVPVDDTNCMFYWIAWHETKGITAQAWRSFCDAVPGVDVDPVTFRKVRNLENDYLQDRAKMKAGDFTGITGIPTQDMAMWESMGPIADRSHDKLGSSDRAIVEFRKIMLQQAMEADSEPPAKTWRNADLFTFEGMVAKQDDWREVRPEAPVPA
jgi:phthalate 4,5-dioxygenase oxygenase subunit